MHRVKATPILVATVLLVCTDSHAATFSDWQFRQELPAPGPGLIKFSLPAETLDASRPDLADLRLADAAGNEVPYLIERPMPMGRRVQSAKSFKVELDQSSTVITLETGLAQPVGIVRLVTPSVNFIKAVAVEGSADGKNWQPLVSGQPIFQQPNGSSQLRVELPAHDWAFLRLSVDDRNSPPVAFTGAELEAAASEPIPLEPVGVQIAERVENPGETRLTLNLGAAHLRLAALDIESPDPLFNRQITLAVRQVEENTVHEKPLANGSIYRVAVAGQKASARLSLPLDLQTPTRELLLLIQNGDSPPLQVTGLRAQRRPVYLLFLAPAASRYAVFTGNPLCAAPRYDLASQGINPATTALSPLSPSAVAPNPGYNTPETLPRVSGAGAALDVSGWRFRKPVSIKSPGVQQLELDLAVLAHAQSGGADLRLCRDGKQIPFIIERTSFFRPLKPEMARADDSRQPKFSRWLLKVPHANLPLARLTCASPTPLFRREVSLYEEPTDERGGKYRHDLGSASWVQSPDRAIKSFMLSLHAIPSTDTLFLETNNEDNPPIELTNFEFVWPATRLFFKTASAENVFLFYGNPAVGAPQYDLSLVANQLLMADKQLGSLASEEQLKKASWAERQTAGQGGLLFWGALAAVVIALLVIIARMVPKPTPPT